MYLRRCGWGVMFLTLASYLNANTLYGFPCRVQRSGEWADKRGRGQWPHRGQWSTRLRVWGEVGQVRAVWRPMSYPMWEAASWSAPSHRGDLWTSASHSGCVLSVRHSRWFYYFYPGGTKSVTQSMPSLCAVTCLSLRTWKITSNCWNCVWKLEDDVH